MQAPRQKNASDAIPYQREAVKSQVNSIARAEDLCEHLRQKT